MDELTFWVNGQERKLAHPATVQRLLEQLELGPESVLVELNRLVLFRRDYEATLLQPDDRVEILEVAAGG